MNIVQIEENVKQLIHKIAQDELNQQNFIYELLLAYGHRNQSIGRVRNGERNLAEDKENSVFWKRQIYFKIAKQDDLHGLIDQMKNEKRTESNKIRFLIVTDFKTLLAVDTKTQDTLDVPFGDLAKKFDFFLPWAGMEKAVYQGENPADVKAAEKLAKLFDEIKADNFDEDHLNNKDNLHQLNIFLSRLLFCYFAEDTEIFKDKQFTSAISKSNKDGSDLSSLITRLFKVLNQASEDRETDLPDYLADFPYVNGGLFKDDIQVPKFTRKSRRILIECGAELDWSDINPDIFGSMFQAAVDPQQRSDDGQHYTSVPNIMKVIEPLFLRDFYEELELAQDNPKKLLEIQQRLGKVKIFDPACGSGNFLIIAYKELRKFEMELLKRIKELEIEKTGQLSKPFSVIQVCQFYGIELDDFAHEIAILSLWLAEHQMNILFKDEFGDASPTLPLKQSGHIISANAVQINWDNICKIQKNDECYILGNPPYKGARKQNESQKNDLKMIFDDNPDYKDSDYVICWLKKASWFIQNKNAKFAFVTTDSICQGEQVAYAWRDIYLNGQEIFFAYDSFDWKNNAKDQAGVSCVIVGVCEKDKTNNKYIYSEKSKNKVIGISPYLKESNNIIFLHKLDKPISKILPKMVSGSMARDGGHLFLNKSEMEDILHSNPECKKVIRAVFGTSEFVSGKERYCIWIDSEEKLAIALNNPKIKKRIDDVKKFRESSTAKTTKGYASIPHMFAQRAHKNVTYIIIPKVSTDKREYLPLGFMQKDQIITDLAFGIYDADLFTFGILSSKMHNIWHKTVSGRLGKGPRYSSDITYNNFPIPTFTLSQKEKIENAAMNILATREEFLDKSISELYDPESMPVKLKQAHTELDNLVSTLYLKKSLKFEYEYIDILFNLYNSMVDKND